MKQNFFIKIVLGTIIMTMISIFFNQVFTQAGSIEWNKIPWYVLSHFMVVLALGVYVTYSTINGFKLILSVFAIYFIIGQLNLLIEAYIFNVTDRSRTIEELFHGLFVAFFFAPIFVYMFSKSDVKSTSSNFISRSVLGWVWKAFLGVFLYLIFYLGAGMILQAVYPELMDFYQGKIPSFDVMILTQIPRGLLFVAVTILVLRTSTLSLMKKAILIGSIFSILGAIAP